MHSLRSNIDKERKLWKPTIINAASDADISAKQRDESAMSIARLAAQFKFLPETCGLAILLMDKFLTTVKVRPKYLQCATVACLYIAAKTLEEDENIPPTQDFVRKSGCGNSFAEITRMELVILTKFDWNIKIPSAIDFLHMIHAVLLMHYPHLLSGHDCMRPSEMLMTALRKLIRCLTCHDLMKFRPSTLALALISLETEQITPGWLRIVVVLQRLTNVGSEQLMHCREMMSSFLNRQLNSSSQGRPRIPSTSTPRTKKRKVDHHVPMESEEKDENIYDGIKRLYSGESEIIARAKRTSCSMEMHQDNEEMTMMNIPVGQTLLVT